jgi:RNA-directed DNA polymerase
LREPWPRVRAALGAGTYRPPPVTRVAIPQPGGGVRQLGAPTALDRVIQQAVLQGLQPEWDKPFSASRDGFRPKRAAPQAGAPAPRDRGEGHGGVVDVDREQCFDRGNHDKLMRLVQERRTARRVWPRSDRDRKAGALTDEGLAATVEGPPPGGPRSP